MEFSDIVKIVDTWYEKKNDILDFEHSNSPYHHNGLRVLTLFRELAEFVKEHEPTLRSWMMAYLRKNPLHIFAMWWNKHFQTWAIDQVKERFPRGPPLHPNIEEQWDSIFGEDQEDRFSVAKRMVDYYHARREVKDCDDVTILAIHEGLECKSDGWDCYYCEPQEHLWAKERVRRIQTCHHPLLNEERCRFLHWCQKAHPELCSWEPPHIWTDKYNNGNTQHIYDWNEYKEYLQTNRETRYSKTGQTPRQAIKDFLLETQCYTGILDISYNRREQKEFNVFYMLWNMLDTIPVTLEYDLKRVEEIQAMF